MFLRKRINIAAVFLLSTVACFNLFLSAPIYGFNNNKEKIALIGNNLLHNKEHLLKDKLLVSAPLKLMVDTVEQKSFDLKIRMFDKNTKKPIGGGVVIFVKSKGDESIKKNGAGKKYIIEGEQEIIFMIKKEGYEDHKFRVSTINKDPDERLIMDIYLTYKLNEDEKAYEDLLDKCGDLKKEGLIYKVQIGAFRVRKIKYFESLNLGYRIFEQQQQGLYKYMIYNAKTPYEIDNVRQDVVNQGISDAFVVPYYKGERYSVKRTLNILIPN